MENRLDYTTDVIAETEAALDKFEAALTEMEILFNYYGSKSWFSDVSAFEKGKLPAGLSCGVLSEDLIYNTIGDRQDIAVRMVELAARILRH